MNPPHAVSTRLPESTWRSRRAAHLARATAITTPVRQRRARGILHPIEDFLFRYYSLPLSRLEAWLPPLGTALEVDALPEEEIHRLFPLSASSPLRIRAGLLFADPAVLTDKERSRLDWVLSLLKATRSRPPSFACHGLHEWAMVFQAEDIRHKDSTPLRLPQHEIDALVRSRPICCSHFDAFRFFAPSARAFNRLQPSTEDRIHLEQPGCLHANMDLYKWSAKALPWAGSELLLDCFLLAREIRVLDMRASPYDLSAWNLSPVPIETPEGRRTYEEMQKSFALRAATLRDRLIHTLESLLHPSSDNSAIPQLPQQLVCQPPPPAPSTHPS